MSGVIFSVEEVSFSEKSGRKILNGISFFLEKGSHTRIKGPSGAGKTTLLRLLCRLAEPSEGRILLNGVPIREIYPPELRKKVSYLHQIPSLMPFSIRENLLLPFSFRVNQGVLPPRDEEMTAWLSSFGLSDISLTDPARNLSVGQMQRICLIRTLAASPEVILLDEPTSSLDENSARIVMEGIETYRREKGAALVIVTHREHPADGHTGTIHLEKGRIRWM